MYSGVMNVMEKVVDRRFDLNDVTEISRITTKYVKTTRSNRDKKEHDANIFTFAFDSDKYPSQYRISVYAGEFVALAIKDPADPNKKKRSIYGHIVDVDTENNSIKFARYVAKNGIRDVYENYNVSLNGLLGIYRYELEISDYVEETPVESEATTEETSTEK